MGNIFDTIEAEAKGNIFDTLETPDEKAARLTAEAIRIEGADPALVTPYIDPISAVTGGVVGAGKAAIAAGVRGLPAVGRALLGGATALLTEAPLGQLAEEVGEKYPRAALPFAVITGVVAGATVERAIEKRVIKALTKKGVKPATKAVDRMVAKVKAELEADDLTRPVAKEVHEELTTLSQKIEKVEVPAKAPTNVFDEVAEQRGKVKEPLTPGPQIVPGDIAAGSLRYGEKLPKEAGNINLDRVGADYSAKKLMLDTSDRYKGAIDEARRGTITLKETQKLADDLGMTPEKLLKRRKGQALNAEEVTAARDLLNSSAKETRRLQVEAATKNTDEALVLARLSMNRHAAIQAEVSGASAEAGRALSAHRIISSEAKNYKSMLDALGGRDLTEDMLDKLGRIDPTNQLAVNKFIRAATKASTSEMIFEAWINGLLSSPTTHMVNTTSNALTFLSKIPEEATAASIDFMRSMVTRTPRERFLGETPHHIFGLWQGIKEGVRKGLSSYSTEIPSQGVSKLEVSKYQAIPSKVFREGAKKKRIFGVPVPLTGEISVGGKQVRIPGRLLTAEDEFFKSINYQAELQSLAYRRAVKKGLKGKARAQDIAETLANPPANLVKIAEGEMLYRVFQKELGKSGKALQSLRMNTPGLKYIIPFLRTPVNIVKFGLERTPLYYPVVIRKMLKGELKGGAVSDELAKATLGSFIASAVAIHAAEGNITGGGPKNRTQREELYRTGWQPYSIKIGDNYVPYGRLEPLGMVMGLTADFVELMDTMSDGETDDVAAKIALAIAQNVTNKTFMSGLSDALNATSDPARYGDRWTKRLVGSVVPRVSATAAKVVDPNFKEPGTYSEVLKANIPFLSRDVPNKHNLWGEPIAIPGTAVERAISPVRRSPIVESKLDDEMVRLEMGIAMPRSDIRGIELTPEEQEWLTVEAGQWAKKRLDARVNSPSWDRRRDEGKKEVIRDIIMAGRKRARGLLLRKIKDRLPRRKAANE